MTIKSYIVIWFSIFMGLSIKAYALGDFTFHDPQEIVLEREKLEELKAVDGEHQDEFIAEKLEVLQKNKDLIAQHKADIQNLKNDIEDLKLLLKQQEESIQLDQDNLHQEIADLLKYLDVLDSYLDQMIQGQSSRAENEMYLWSAFDDLSMVLMAYYFDYMKYVELPKQFMIEPPSDETQEEGDINYKEEDPSNFVDNPDRNSKRDQGGLSPVLAVPGG